MRGRTCQHSPPSRYHRARSARCDTVKVPAESAGAVAIERQLYLRSQTSALGGRPDKPAGAPGIPSGRGCYLQ
eukprot:scaffold32439_cov48-Phaeocystis_antarctica.AAC.1